ncbi:hypothetical protein [Massilia sp. ZL223]|uniref:hypothetical protein n=1 Tax=Massilia sp. ZL223 TaxID=2824904 RepID=UPI001B83B3EB|nr:hypothetical protein [Massilia sp. ZL223]MBQ5963371.1 hypothetical protein [Massilia sp. ZL223]
MDKSIVLKILRDAFRIDRVRYPESRVLTVAHDNDRSLLHNGRWYSPLVDTMEDDLRLRDLRCASIARIISRIKGDVAYGNVMSPEGAFARALLVKRLSSRFSGGVYPYSAMEEKIWGHILDETGARKVFGIQPSREMCVACHKRGVWVADVQHGVIGESHPWYGIRFRGEDPKEWLPDAFVVWDAGSAAVIDRWAAAKGIETIVTGNRWVARFLKRAPHDRLVEELFATYGDRLAAPTGMKSILITLSWGNENIPNGFLPDALCDIIRSTQGRYDWKVRLHPNQLSGFATHEGQRFNQFFEKHLKGLVEWEAATRAPLPVVLAQTDLHLSWASSVAIEAAQCGIRSGLMEPALRDPNKFGDYYTYYRNRGMIDFLEPTQDGIIDWISANLDSRQAPEAFGAYDQAYARLLDFLAN